MEIYSARPKVNTRKIDYKVAVTLDGKVIDTFATPADSVVNALRSAFEQCCGYAAVARQPDFEPIRLNTGEVIPSPPAEPKRRGRTPKNENP